jgi:hypothetical protein
MQPYHAIDDGRWADKAHRPEAGPDDVRVPVAAGREGRPGLRLGLGRAPLSPLAGIFAAATRRTIDGKNPNGWVPEQRITVEEALRAYTSSRPGPPSRKKRRAPSLRKARRLRRPLDDPLSENPKEIEKIEVGHDRRRGKVGLLPIIPPLPPGEGRGEGVTGATPVALGLN